MKEYDKNLQDQINEEESSNQPEKEVRVIIVKMIQKLENKMKAQIIDWRHESKRCKKCLART